MPEKLAELCARFFKVVGYLKFSLTLKQDKDLQGKKRPLGEDDQSKLTKI